MIFLFPRWDMLIPWRVPFFVVGGWWGGVSKDTPHSERGTFPKEECRRLGLDTAGCQDREDLIRALETPRKW